MKPIIITDRLIIITMMGALLVGGLLGWLSGPYIIVPK